MKISNETKIGILTAFAITVLVLGFNFLKGKTIFGKSHNLFAKYTNVQGLAASNPIMINGLQIGTVYSITTDKNMKQILVNMNLTKDVNIPVNSVAIIETNPLGTTSIDIKLGDANTYLAKDDTVKTAPSFGIFNQLVSKVDPVFAQINQLAASVDSVLQSVNRIIDPNAKKNIGAMLENLNRTSANLINISSSMDSLLNPRTGGVAKALNNLNTFTGNLNSNNGKINRIVTNLDKTSANLAKADIDKTLNVLNEAADELKSVVGKLNSPTGTAGLLLNDTKLYNNLNATANKVNLLIDDLKTNPKRYVSFSVFGKKNKTTGLSTPLPDTLNAPYIK